jgi:hypothetical protein
MFFKVHSAPLSFGPSIVTGFEIEPLPDGNISIQFFDDDGKTINLVSVTRDCLKRLPIVVHAFFLATNMGKGEAMESLNIVKTI